MQLNVCLLAVRLYVKKERKAQNTVPEYTPQRKELRVPRKHGTVTNRAKMCRSALTSSHETERNGEGFENTPQCMMSEVQDQIYAAAQETNRIHKVNRSR